MATPGETQDGDPPPRARHHHGLVDNFEGKLSVYLWPKAAEKGDWQMICNFSMKIEHHAMNEIEGQSRCYIVRCTLGDKENGTIRSFHVPVTQDDCDDEDKLYKVFKDRKKGHSGVIIKGVAKKNERLTKWCLQLIAKYEKGQSSPKKGSLVASKVGFVQAQLDNGSTGTVYIAGPNCALAVSGLSNDEVEKLNVVWIGPPNVPDLRVQSIPTPDFVQSWIVALCDYYGVNKGSVFALFGQLYLNMNMRELRKNGLKLASTHLVGDMGVGKSEIACHMQSMFPRIYEEERYTQQNDRKMSVTMLSQESAKARPFNVQDPPVTDYTKLRVLFDDFFEHRLPVNQKSAARFENNTVCSSLLVAWKNEDRQLLHFDFTCLTKCLILLHVKQDCSLSDMSEKRNKLQDMMQESSCLFPSFVTSIDFDLLKAKVSSLKDLYLKVLVAQFPVVETCPRILDIYALTHAAALLWVEKQTWTDESHESMLDYANAALTSFFTETCLPFLIKRIQLEQDRQSGSSAKLSELVKTFADHLASLTPKEFFCKVSFSEKEGLKGKIRVVCFGKSIWEGSDKLILATRALFKNELVIKAPFSTPEAKTLWHKRSFRENKGNFKRKEAFAVDVQLLDSQVFESVCQQLNKHLKDVVITRDTLIKELLDEKFNNQESANSSDTEQDEEEVDASLERCWQTLDIKQRKELLMATQKVADGRNLNLSDNNVEQAVACTQTESMDDAEMQTDPNTDRQKLKNAVEQTDDARPELKNCTMQTEPVAAIQKLENAVTQTEPALACLELTHAAMQTEEPLKPEQSHAAMQTQEPLKPEQHDAEVQTMLITTEQDKDESKKLIIVAHSSKDTSLHEKSGMPESKRKADNAGNSQPRKSTRLHDKPK
jgi:hypothetical protein